MRFTTGIALCGNLPYPCFERHLVYDNSACRNGKGTLLMNRLNAFLREYCWRYRERGYFLKCDIREFFDSIDRAV